MKNFYAFAAAIAAGSMVAAMAFTPGQFDPENLVPRSLDNLPVLKSEPTRSLSKSLRESRAAEDEPGVTNCTLMLYTDLFEMTDEEGYLIDDWAYTYADVKYETHDDVVLMYNTFGVPSFEPLQFNVTEDGGLELVLGTLMFNSAKYKYVSGVLDASGSAPVVTGTWPVKIYENAIGLDGTRYFGMAALDPVTEEVKGFGILAYGANWFMPNATIEYQNTMIDAEKNETTRNIKKDIFVQYEKDGYELAGKTFDWYVLTDYNIVETGYAINFIRGANGITMTSAEKPMGYPTELTDAETGEETGIFYFQSIDTENSTYMDGAYAYLSEDGEYMEFPYNYPSLDTNYDMWFVVTESDICMGYNSPAKVYPIGGDAGVAPIINSNVDSPVEYYNLQGMKLTQPEAGQLVIKKQGGNVSKLIVR